MVEYITNVVNNEVNVFANVTFQLLQKIAFYYFVFLSPAIGTAFLFAPLFYLAIF